MKKALTLLLLAITSMTKAQQNCESIFSSSQYFSVFATAPTENEARTQALSLLAENISSVVSSRTDMHTSDDRQTFYNATKSTSVLHLSGVRYITCDKKKKDGVTVLAYISAKDLAQSSSDVAARVRQYIELMEQKEANGTDFLPEAYIAYLYTFTSPYTIEFHSDKRHISDVRGYLESFLRTSLSNITIKCTGVSESPDYPDHQLTLSLVLEGMNTTSMKFLLELPEYGAKGTLLGTSDKMDVIMTPDSRKTKFSGILSLAPPNVEDELKEIRDQVVIGLELSFEADMSNVIKLDFSSVDFGDQLQLTPITRHLSARQVEWLSNGNLLSTEQRPRIDPSGLTDLTLRVNGSQDLTVTKTLDIAAGYDKMLQRSKFTTRERSLKVEWVSSSDASAALGAIDSPFPEDAIVLVQTSVPNLVFRSSMSAIDKQVYNSAAQRYEITVKPVKQLLVVEGGGFTEKSIGIINPRSAEVLNYRITSQPAETLISKGVLSIMSDPSDASIFINDIETVYRTPFTILIADGTTKISLRKKYHEPLDTVVHIDSKNPVNLVLTLSRLPGSPAADITSSEALRYLRGAPEKNYYQDMLDPVQKAEQDKLRQYQLKLSVLRRNATMCYTSAVLFVSLGAFYDWMDRLVYDAGTPHSATFTTMADACYVVGGASIVGGIIYSTKISHHKKSWSIQPTPVKGGGGGVAMTLKF